MITSLNDFHFYVGKTVMYCQCIEHDIKHIYAGMLAGDFAGNLREIERWTLGQTVRELRALDHSDGHPYFTAQDYSLLSQVTDIRNYWAHTAYATFIYGEGDEVAEKFRAAASRLWEDHTRLDRVYRGVERIRAEVLQKYHRT
jgi:hypothetical protein